MFLRYFPIAAACFLLVAAPARAIVLAPGAVVFPTGTTSAADPNLAGVVQNDNLINFQIDPTPATPFTTTGGAVQNRAVLSNLTNTMIFGPRIRDTFNIDVTLFEITTFRLTGYGGFSTDVDFRTDGLGDDGFTSVSRSVDGDTMTFRYADPLSIDGIAPGVQEESLFPSILTDAPNYSLTGTMTIFGIDAANPDTLWQTTIRGIAVPAPVPLPAPLLLFASALAGLGLVRRSRRA